jgi:5,5'-dehydrodivanillate O-demethylase
MADAVLAGKLSIHEIEDRPDIVNIQDHVAQEGQGAIPDRNAERLGQSDAAVILMRKIWLRELRALSEGGPLKPWSLPDAVVASSGV